MTRSKKWHVEIFIDEHDEKTRAEARLHTNDASQLAGRGTARLNPVDRSIPEIGDELAVARALSDLAHLLLSATADDIEMVTHQPAQLDPVGSTR